MISDEDIAEVLGLSISDVGRNVFGGVHTAGKVLASAFGAGSLAQSVENLEAGAGLLPDWARSAPKPGASSTSAAAAKPTAPTRPGAPSSTPVKKGKAAPASAAPNPTPVSAPPLKIPPTKARGASPWWLYVGAGTVAATGLVLIVRELLAPRRRR